MNEIELKKGLELAGIEPASPRCDRGALPLCDSPYRAKPKRAVIVSAEKVFSSIFFGGRHFIQNDQRSRQAILSFDKRLGDKFVPAGHPTVSRSTIAICEGIERTCRTLCGLNAPSQQVPSPLAVAANTICSIAIATSIGVMGWPQLIT